MLTLLRLRTTATLFAVALIFVAHAALGPSDAAAGGGGCHGGRPMTDERTTTVMLAENCMGPTVARVDPGDAVTFVNKDMAPHTVTGANMLWGSDVDLLQGDEITHVFNDAGVFPYYCLFHPGMAGAIVVGDGQGPAQASAGAVTSGRLLLASDAASAGAAAGSPAQARGAADDGIAWTSIAIASVIGIVVAAALAVVAHARGRQRRLLMR